MSKRRRVGGAVGLAWIHVQRRAKCGVPSRQVLLFSLLLFFLSPILLVFGGVFLSFDFEFLCKRCGILRLATHQS